MNSNQQGSGFLRLWDNLLIRSTMIRVRWVTLGNDSNNSRTPFVENCINSKDHLIINPIMVTATVGFI